MWIRMTVAWVKMTREQLPKRNHTLFGGKRNLRFWLTHIPDGDGENFIPRQRRNQPPGNNQTQTTNQTPSSTINTNQPQQQTHHQPEQNTANNQVTENNPLSSLDATWAQIATHAGNSKNYASRFIPSYQKKNISSYKKA